MNLTSIYADLFRPPPDRIFGPHEDTSQYYRHWGFTIYRTAYSPESEPLWQTLLAKMHAQVEENIIGLNALQKDDPVAQHIMSLFRLDVHSDTDTLKDLDMDSLRVLYKESMEGNLMIVNDMRRRHFILVDCELLASGFRMGTWVKYVDADYVADNYIAKSRRVTQRYFGWMKMTTRSLVELW